jgi:type VI secretion system secreted protein VgrG
MTSPFTSVAPYQLSVDGFAAGHFRVHSLKGNETISEAWWFDVVVTAPAGDDVERGALAQRATLIFNVHEDARAFYGVVSSVRLAEVHAVDRVVQYVVRLVPRLWLLRRKTRSRIFQNMRVPDVVSSVLLEAGITTRWQLVRAYPQREYCTQYEETDYQFVRRILAEAGIYFYFFGGGPVSAAAFAADAAVGVAASVGSSVAGFVGGSAIGGLLGAAAQMAETLIPGDTVVGADDAPCYPPVGGDDAGALAASTAAAMAPAIGDVVGGALGVSGGIGGTALGAASAVAGTVSADLTEGARAVPALHFMANEAANVTTYDKVTRFTLRNSVRSTGAAFRDYDPDRPMVRLQSVAVSTQPFPPSPFEIAAEAAAAAESAATAAGGMLGGSAAGALGAVSGAIATVDSAVNAVGAALGQKVPYEVYEHHAPFLFPKWAFGSNEAPRILRQERRRASIAQGEGGCCDFSPAHRFTLEDHPAVQLDGAYVVTTVEHRGEVYPSSEGAWRVYWNRFECAPAQMPYVPARPKRKSVQVSLTATVVGPQGEEIYVDQKGQIKVQFHWDREGQFDQNSSCWIRTMQPWAGAAWGHQFIPRVGMEVVVTFEGGDPDKPMVLGSLYNATHPPPFSLPGDKTRSGWRTQSSPGGGGFNELSFEDRVGGEQILLHAQRDHLEKVEVNQTIGVGADQSIMVGLDRLIEVKRNQSHTIHGDTREKVEGKRQIEVQRNSETNVHENYKLTVGGSLSQSAGARSMTAFGEHYMVAALAGGCELVLGPRNITIDVECCAGGATPTGSGTMAMSSGTTASSTAGTGGATTGTLVDGVTCTKNDQCASGFCVDGQGSAICCKTACSGNFACASTGTCNATCTSDGDCALDYACSSAGACLLTNGQTCATASQCASGLCVDGVCCNSPCTDSCHACSAALRGGTDGVCANATDHSIDPRGICIESELTSCGTDGKCSGGACEDWPSTTVCGTVQCFNPVAPSDACTVTLQQCDGMGNCATSGAAETCPTSPNNYCCATVDTACGCGSNANCPAATPTCRLPAGICVP